MSKNVVDAYKEFNGQLIILISGLSGSGKTALGKNISHDFKIKLIDMNDFYKENFDEKIKLPNNKTVVNYDTDNAVNWTKINKEINDFKKDGVVVIGNVFPTDKLQFKTDFHVHLKITKQELKNKRLNYIEKHKNKGFDVETESLRINMYTYPYYLETMKRMKFTKFIDVTELSNDAIYDDIFDVLIKHITDSLHSSKQTHHESHNNTTKSKINNTNSDSETHPDEDYYVHYEYED